MPHRVKTNITSVLPIHNKILRTGKVLNCAGKDFDVPTNFVSGNTNDHFSQKIYYDTGNLSKS